MAWHGEARCLGDACDDFATQQMLAMRQTRGSDFAGKEQQAR